MNRPTESRPTRYFEEIYARDPDPWDFATSDYERAKYEATVAALPKTRYARGFEVGCSIGVLSRMLAARCLLVTSVVQETSSLVAREALACGTPVIAFPNGAVPEAIEPGRTGFLMDDVDGMAAAIRAAGTLDPEACRRAARERFSLRRMVERYFDIYRRLARGEQPCAA